MRDYERHLTERDRDILQFIARYRIGTIELLRRQCFQSRATAENVRRVLRRLEHRELARRVDCSGGYSYFAPTRRTLELAGSERRTPQSLTEQTLPIALSVATYCVSQGIQRMTSAEFREIYPELWRPGMGSSSHLLVERDGRLQLEMLMVDRGGAAHRINAQRGPRHRPTEEPAQVPGPDEGGSILHHRADGHRGAGSQDRPPCGPAADLTGPRADVCD